MLDPRAYALASHSTGDYDIPSHLRQAPSYVTIGTTREMTTALLREVGRGEGCFGVTIRSVPLTPEEVGTRIRHAREEMKPKRWSQLDLAVALGVSPASIYRWEKGRLPSMNELVRLSEILDIPLEELTEPPERRVEMDDLRDALGTILHRLDELEASVEERGQIVADSLDRTATLLEHLVGRAHPDTERAKASP